MKNLKKLPVGIQTFSEIIDKDYLYIDKTRIALDLIENCKYVFLSRPRRFGKSLFLDTLHNIFEGNKELFEGLYIYDQWDWETKYPVIKMSFSGDLRSGKSLKNNILNILIDNQEKLDITTKLSKLQTKYDELARAINPKPGRKRLREEPALPPSLPPSLQLALPPALPLALPPALPPVSPTLGPELEPDVLLGGNRNMKLKYLKYKIKYLKLKI